MAHGAKGGDASFLGRQQQAGVLRAQALREDPACLWRMAPRGLSGISPPGVPPTFFPESSSRRRPSHGLC